MIREVFPQPLKDEFNLLFLWLHFLTAGYKRSKHTCCFLSFGASSHEKVRPPLASSRDKT
ncbi:CLUMA_CG019775, isoform A [Clunio marinus]|uniref:CLUMA_CG019775, isoform A n=1 Tax=Clunio marinus TaxID=568069 RepID=A0A1J1J464_9DIPT|nr:CLUMA_CG019775, isoform A [Clunio marinus]